MATIGVLFGMENVFPGALVERINSLRVPDVDAEFVQIGGVAMNAPCRYQVIVDRISHDIPFYRAYLKQAALAGTYVISNPFWASADDKFFNYALAARLGVAVPPTVVLPHKEHPSGTTDKSMRNLLFPLNWDEVFAYVGFPAFLKPFDGGGWRDVFQVKSPDEFFAGLRPDPHAVHDAAARRQLHRVLPLLRRRPAGRARDALRPARALPPALRASSHRRIRRR